MATRQDIEAKLAAIEQRKTEALKTLQAKRLKLKAKLAQFDRHDARSQRRIDARRKILLGAFVLEQLERTGSSPQNLSFEGQRFFEWLVRPTDRAVFDAPLTGDTAPQGSPHTPGAAATVTILNVPFADKDRAKSLGAHWHANQKRWVVPPGLDLTPFAAWLE